MIKKIMLCAFFHILKKKLKKFKKNALDINRALFEDK